MGAFERRTKILDFLQREKRASTRILSEQFQVSEVTIRHDLTELAEQGWIARTHGGASAVYQPEQPLAERETVRLPEKTRIARAAVQLIQPGDRIILDSSTTVLQLATEIKQRADLSNLTVVTSNLRVAMVVASRPDIDVLIVGGFVRGETWSVVGPIAEQMIGALHVRMGFFGAAGVALERGLTDADIREAQVKQALMRAVDEVTVLVDSSKFGKQSFSKTIDLDAVRRIITDQNVPQEYLESFQESGLDVQLV